MRKNIPDCPGTCKIKLNWKGSRICWSFGQISCALRWKFSCSNKRLIGG